MSRNLTIKALLLAGVIALPLAAGLQPAAAQQGAAPEAAPAAAPVAAKPKPASKPAAKPAAKPRKGKQAAAKPAEPDPTLIQCDGAFGKDSSHAKLVETFGADNVTYQIIDGPEGTKLHASVLFADDPARHVEVLWHEEEARKRPQSIILGPQATWKIGKGLHLGSTLHEVEKQNGKAFKLMGFDWDSGGMVSDWQGGAYGKLAGDCKLGVRFTTDDKAPAKARDKVVGDKEFASTDSNMRAVKPKISELFISYPE